MTETGYKTCLRALPCNLGLSFLLRYSFLPRLHRVDSTPTIKPEPEILARKPLSGVDALNQIVRVFGRRVATRGEDAAPQRVPLSLKYGAKYEA